MSWVLQKYPLHTAAESGNINEVKRLIKSGADVNKKNVVCASRECVYAICDCYTICVMYVCIRSCVRVHYGPCVCICIGAYVVCRVNCA